MTGPVRPPTGRTARRTAIVGPVVGIDPSLTATGVAVLRPPAGAETPNRPALHTLGENGRAGATTVDRAARIDRQVRRVLAAVPASTSLVVIELLDTFMPGRGALTDRIGLWWALVRAVGRAGVPLAVVHTGTLKSWATGDGRADKKAMVQAARELWPTATIRNDNEADALLLSTMGAMHIGWYEPELPHHVSPKVEWPKEWTRK